jgi:hypothetical protein
MTTTTAAAPGPHLGDAPLPDPWGKVRDLKTGTDLRIIKAGAAAPVMAKFAELTGGQPQRDPQGRTGRCSAGQDRADRLSSAEGLRENGEKTTAPSDGPGGAKTVPGEAPSSSYSTGVAISDKIEFDPIYRRTPAVTPGKK